MGLDQYLYKVKKKCATEGDLNKIRSVRAIYENPERLKYYDEIKIGKYDNYLDKEFTNDFAKSVKLGFQIEESSTLIDKAVLKTLTEDEKKRALEAKNDFLKFYVKDFISSVKTYTEAICNGETVDNFKSIDIGYWRKHSDLQGYMEDLYRKRGGHGNFNCVDLILSKEDCEDVIEYSRQKLQNSSKGIKEEHTTGFFFGKTQDSDWADTIDIFNNVLADTDWEHETIYYSSWW